MYLTYDENDPASSTQLQEIDCPFDSVPLEIFRNKGKSSLFGGLYGTLPPPAAAERFSALLITHDYDDPVFHQNALDISPLLGSNDRSALRQALLFAGFQNENITCLSNKMADRSHTLDALSRVGINPTPTTIFMQGHGLPGKTDETIEFVPHDYYMSNPPRGITCAELRKYLSPRSRSVPTRRLILTDFCLGYNFNELKYTLERTPGKPAQWAISEEWDGLEYEQSTNDVVVHFAAGGRGELVYENENGGLFAQTLCEAMKDRPRGLPDLLDFFRDGVQRLGTMRTPQPRTASAYSRDASRIQTPQIYSSHKLDLEDPYVLQRFGWFCDQIPTEYAD